MSMQRCCPPPPKIAGADLSGAAMLFKAISDPNRLAILAWLGRIDEEVCVCDFTDALPLNQPTVSHHLKILRDAELVTSERRGTWVYYRLASRVRQRIAVALDSVLPERELNP
jgi:ArsR family transcriptional regulator